MKTTLIVSSCMAIALTGFMAPAEAQSYHAHSRTDARVMTYEQCVSNQRGRRVAGALIGGLLGAAIGAEIHDDRQDRDFDRAYRRGDLRRAGAIARRENDGTVATGAGIGALAGATIAGSDRDNCARFAHGRSYDRGYDHRHNSGYSRHSDRYSYNRHDHHSYSHNDRHHYSSSHSSHGELAGGYDYRNDGYDTRTYRASTSRLSSTGNCRDMHSGGYLTYMCQGTDGIWRPADTYN